MSEFFGAVVTPTGLRFEDAGQVKAYVHGKFAQGEVVAVRIDDWQNTRSLKANAYLWGVVYAEIAKHTGEKPERIHDAMCQLHLPNEQERVDFYNQTTGEHLGVEFSPHRTSRLTGGRFYDFVEDVRQWAREFLQVETQDPEPEFWRKREPREKLRSAS